MSPEAAAHLEAARGNEAEFRKKLDLFRNQSPSIFVTITSSLVPYVQFLPLLLLLVGALIGIYNGWSDMETMEFASSCAVMALRSPDATSGMGTEAEIKDYCRQFTRREAE